MEISKLGYLGYLGFLGLVHTLLSFSFNREPFVFGGIDK